MTDAVELWIVDEATRETVLLIEERRRCPVHATPLNDDGTCDGWKLGLDGVLLTSVYNGNVNGVEL